MNSKILFQVFVLFAKNSLFFHIHSSYVISITVTKVYHNTSPQTAATCLAFQDYDKQFDETLDNPGENIFCDIQLAINMSNSIASQGVRVEGRPRNEKYPIELYTQISAFL